MAEIHDRMPVILPPEAHDDWLAEPREDLLRPVPAEGLVAYPVKNVIGDDELPETLKEGTTPELDNEKLY